MGFIGLIRRGLDWASLGLLCLEGILRWMGHFLEARSDEPRHSTSGSPTLGVGWHGSGPWLHGAGLPRRPSGKRLPNMVGHSGGQGGTFTLWYGKSRASLVSQWLDSWVLWPLIVSELATLPQAGYVLPPCVLGIADCPPPYSLGTPAAFWGGSALTWSSRIATEIKLLQAPRHRWGQQGRGLSRMQSL